MSNTDGEKFELSRDELQNISRCLENEEFRKLFVEYCEELNDPANRKQYEDELKILEAERGYDVKFINPKPGYVIKTVSQENLKVFVNICYCDLVGRPISQGSTNESGQRGLKWSIPYAQSHPRKDYDNRKKECVVYDVVFHHDTLKLANSNRSFRKLVTDTALDAVEKSFEVLLDKANLKFPKLQYKGVPKMTVIRQKLNNQNFQNECLIDKMDSTKDKKIKNKASDSFEKSQCNEEAVSYVTPAFKLIHRKNIEYHELTNEVDAKLEAAIPKELVLTIQLPLLKSAADCHLNITNKKIYLVSENPAKYKLHVKLPYEVSEKEGHAKFNTDEKTLTITLPTSKKVCTMLENLVSLNHIDSHNSPATTPVKTPSVLEETQNTPAFKVMGGPQVISNLESKKIVFPKFSTNRMENTFAFTLNVRNVDPASIELQTDTEFVRCLFTNVSTGFFPCYYIFCVRFPNANVAEVLHEEWDNNFILQVILVDSTLVDCYYAGPDENNLIKYHLLEDISQNVNKFEKEIEDDSLSIAVSKAAAKRERKTSSGVSIEIKTRCDLDTSDDDITKNAIDQNCKTDLPSKKDKTVNEINICKDNSTISFSKHEKYIEVDNELSSQTDDKELRKQRRNSRKKNKKRSLSESCCDNLKVIMENEISKLERTNNISSQEDSDLKNEKPLGAVANVTQRKPRSKSESFSFNTNTSDHSASGSTSMDNLSALIQFNRKCKGILKRSCFERSISECSSFDDHTYLATSMDGGSSLAESIDHSHGELSEYCRKTVRFNDLIKTKIFRSNSSILAQKKKNAKKNESKRRAQSRRLSEGESTDNDDKELLNDSKPDILEVQSEPEHDSGISLDSDAGQILEKDTNLKNEQNNAITKPISIGQLVTTDVPNSKKNVKDKKTKSLLRKTVQRSDSSDIGFKSDMIFDIEM
ncbi:protein kintoun [Wyeomyia smithii]|uniref:protein kintoun n=1 Tax=Wyeomyia smithii TaxID=174621 RepID=UPI002467DAA3|nr:protein kintoun [Wyeomyia smithii]XP_055533920.1 protein kintoun [Wyeomyia smithii]